MTKPHTIAEVLLFREEQKSHNFGLFLWVVFAGRFRPGSRHDAISGKTVSYLGTSRPRMRFQARATCDASGGSKVSTVRR
jgi:hypothetical protein